MTPIKDRWPLALSTFASRATVKVLNRVILKSFWPELLGMITARHTGCTLPLGVWQAANQIYALRRNIDHVFTRGKAAIDYHLLGRRLQVLFNMLQSGAQLLVIVALLSHVDCHHDLMAGFGGDLHVVAGRIPTSGL